jgi:hypothetical protein
MRVEIIRPNISINKHNLFTVRNMHYWSMNIGDLSKKTRSYSIYKRPAVSSRRELFV